MLPSSLPSALPPFLHSSASFLLSFLSASHCLFLRIYYHEHNTVVKSFGFRVTLGSCFRPNTVQPCDPREVRDLSRSQVLLGKMEVTILIHNSTY